MSKSELNQVVSEPISDSIVTTWLFNGSYIGDDKIPKTAQFFIYKIKHIETGKWYIGRKTLFSTKTKQVKGKKKKYKVESDWKTYWSSSDKLQTWIAESKEEHFVREILIFVDTAAACMYAEEWALYFTGALFDPLCMNENIRAKIMRKWFMNKEKDLHTRLAALHLNTNTPG